MLVLSSSAVVGCASGEDRVSEVQPGGPGREPTPTRPAATEPRLQATATAPTVDPATATLAEPGTQPAPTTAAPAQTPGTAGGTTTEVGPVDDGEAIRVPADFTIAGGGVTPGRVSVPAFLTIAISASSKDGRGHTLRISTPKGPITLQVPPGGSATKNVEGLPDGEYLVAIDGQPTDGALVVGGEPGP